MKPAICVLAISLIGCGIGANEEGYHRGKIIDVSRAGWWCPTYEGEVMSGSGNSSVKYGFTIESKELFDKLKEAQAKDIEINLHYYSPRFYSLCSSAHSNFVDGISPVGEAKP